MLAAMIVRGAQDAAIQHLFASVADETRSSWQRSALLRGAEVALLGAAMPGTPAGRRPWRDGDAGRGVAVPHMSWRTRRSGRRIRVPDDECPRSRRAGAAAAPGLRLNREPAPLSELAARGGDLGARAANLLARVAWPGKPGAGRADRAADVRRNSSAFDAGREIYRNICQACHQPDGRGQDKLAPTLIESALALAPAEIPARILLGGKEGPVGLMPPVGSALSDEQIAAVLTYIRREWGQAGSPVDPAIVKEVRALTAGRTRPWTNEELLALSERAQAVATVVDGHRREDTMRPASPRTLRLGIRLGF